MRGDLGSWLARLFYSIQDSLEGTLLSEPQDFPLQPPIGHRCFASSLLAAGGSRCARGPERGFDQIRKAGSLNIQQDRLVEALAQATPPPPAFLPTLLRQKNH